MEGNQQDEDGNEISRQAESHHTRVPDLALTLQAMSLVEPGIGSLRSSYVMQKKDLDCSFCLLMKIACTGGTPRNISLQAVEEAMERAWRNSYYGISQVSSSVFIAHFKSQEDMVSVFIRQPWIVNSENLLLEWFDPEVNVESSDEYKFDQILVTIRAYGIPTSRRSISLLSDILNQIGAVSEFHIMQDANLFARQDYIWGTARLKVNCPVKDRMIVSYPDNSSDVAYLHYEKIRRICLFCRIMFHNVQHCSVRNSLITERSKSRFAGPDVPVNRFGQWIIDEKYIPPQAIQSTSIGSVARNQEGNPVLRRLQELFAEDAKGKGKASDEHRNWKNNNWQEQNRPHSATVNLGQQLPLHQNHPGAHSPPLLMQSSSIFVPGQKVGQPLASSSTPDTLCQQRSRVQLHLTENSELQEQNHHHIQRATPMPLVKPAMESRVAPPVPALSVSAIATTGIGIPPANEAPIEKLQPKRQAPASILSSPPLPKRASPQTKANIHGLPNQPLQQTDAGQSSPLLQPPASTQASIHPHLPSAGHASLQPISIHSADAATTGGILGAYPRGRSQSEERGARASINHPTDSEGASRGPDPAAAEGKHRRRPSGWDIQAAAQSGAHHPSPMGITFYQPGAASWRRIGDPGEMGNIGPYRRSRSSSMGQRTRPYTASPRRSPAGAAEEYDPLPLHPVSPAWSVGTQDSRHGGFSPPPMAHDYYVGPDAPTGNPDQGGAEEIGNEAQSRAAAEDSQFCVHASLQEGNRGRNMDLDDEAMAPASKAPRAP